MAIAVKKKKKKGGSRFGGRASGSAGSSREQSPLRPEHVEKLPPCRSACPNETKIRDIITTIAQTEDRGRTYPESYKLAYDLLIERNPLPSVCGRVCPHPCEGECNRQYKDGSVAINNIERFVGDYAIEHDFPMPKLTDETYDEKISIIGAGPAGISAAYQLARYGYKNITIYEAFSKPGGMLRYGIPDYRLPQDVLDKEIQRVLDMGIDLKTNTIIGKDIPYEKLQEESDAIFVGIGAHKGKSLRLEHEDAENVMSGVYFLNMINKGKPVEVGDKVLVVGGGDTAIDAARISRRLGAEVTIVYRRTRNEMPAIEEEIVGAEEEGVKMEFLVAPNELILDENGRVKAMKCQKMELGEPDASGRRRPVPIDEYITYDCSFVIPAISQEPDFDNLDMLHEGKDWVKVEEDYQTKLDKTFAGGDTVDLGLVTIAIYQGRKAAETIHCNFRGIEPEEDPELKEDVLEKNRIVFDYYANKVRNEPEHLSPEERLKSLDTEIGSTFDEQSVIDESKRCFSCGSCFDCGTCWSMCQDQAIHKPLEKFGTYTFKLDVCKGCNKCADACPCGYIEMKNPMTGKYAPHDEQGHVVYP